MFFYSLEKYRRTSVPPENKPSDPMANPKFFNNTWTNWWDERLPKGMYSRLPQSNHTVNHLSSIALLLQNLNPAPIIFNRFLVRVKKALKLNLPLKAFLKTFLDPKHR